MATAVSSLAREYDIQFFTIRVHQKLDYPRLRRMGINRIIFRVFQDTPKNGGLYFSNPQFRTLEPALEKLIREFDFGRTQLCAWMIGRKFKWDSRVSMFDYRYEDGKRERVAKYDIFNPDAVSRIISVFKTLASNRIDCILIQDDFMLRYNEGFSNWGKAHFTGTLEVPARESSMMKVGTPYHFHWKRIKREQLNRVLTDIVRNCKMVNSAIKVGMNVYYETPLFVDKAETWYSHNLKELVATGLDYIYLMSYQRQIKDEMKLSETENREMFKRIVEKAYEICKDRLVVKLQVKDWNTGKRVPAEELKAYLALIPTGVKRVCFTPVSVKDLDYLEEVIGSSL